jgi:hypothetical protein
MKTTFTQEFRTEPAYVYILAQDDISKKYALLHPVDEWEEDFFGTLRFVLTDDQLALQLVRFLDNLGLDVMNYRELARRTSVQYSFADNTPGTMSDNIRLHATVNATNRLKKTVDGQMLDWFTLAEIREAMTRSPFSMDVVTLGLTQLYVEDTVLDEAE